jgi:outer membrane scaffolding protein for murein synthesis (MipA/OmpV family)
MFRHIRGLYVWKQGQYPRTALGVTVGVVDATNGAGAAAEGSSSGAGEFLPYGDPDERRVSHLKRLLGKRGAGAFAGAALDQPVASVSLCHALNARNKVSLHVTSVRALAACFTYNIQPGVKLQTGLSTQLNSWNLMDVATKPGGLGKPQLGLAVSIGAF